MTVIPLKLIFVYVFVNLKKKLRFFIYGNNWEALRDVSEIPSFHVQCEGSPIQLLFHK